LSAAVTAFPKTLEPKDGAAAACGFPKAVTPGVKDWPKLLMNEPCLVASIMLLVVPKMLSACATALPNTLDPKELVAAACGFPKAVTPGVKDWPKLFRNEPVLVAWDRLLVVPKTLSEAVKAFPNTLDPVAGAADTDTLPVAAVLNPVIPLDVVLPMLLPLTLPDLASAELITRPVHMAMMINTVSAKRILLLTIFEHQRSIMEPGHNTCCNNERT
jgi:hypothetical protein